MTGYGAIRSRLYWHSFPSAVWNGFMCAKFEFFIPFVRSENIYFQEVRKYSDCSSKGLTGYRNTHQGTGGFLSLAGVSLHHFDKYWIHHHCFPKNMQQSPDIANLDHILWIFLEQYNRGVFWHLTNHVGTGIYPGFAWVPQGLSTALQMGRLSLCQRKPWQLPLFLTRKVRLCHSTSCTYIFSIEFFTTRFFVGTCHDMGFLFRSI